MKQAQDCRLIRIEKNAMLLEINVGLEAELREAALALEKAQIQNHSLEQKIALSQNELLKVKQELVRADIAGSNSEIATLKTKNLAT